MTVTENQRLIYRDKFRSLHNEAFQSWFETLARSLHEPGDFQAIRKTQGDGGLDGLVINSHLVYQVYAPARMNELRDGETAAKIRLDFQTALNTLGESLNGWVFLHNHPEGKIGKLTADALSALSKQHPHIKLRVLDIDSLWAQLKKLPDHVLDELFESSNQEPSSSSLSSEPISIGLHNVLSTRLASFLEEYVGSSTRPTPFGGRDLEINRLNQWLSEFSTSYLLISGQAGVGKSALLAQWFQQYLSTQNFRVIFYPISIRFRSNLASVAFPDLASQLAVIHGQKLTPPGSHSELWRGQVAEFLRQPIPDGRTLILILDGLDEAADWELGSDLLPIHPPKNLRVIVSTRYSLKNTSAKLWLKSLRWHKPGLGSSFDLEPLSASGIRDVLIKTSDRGIPNDENFVTQLLRLTSGDPLLIRLYIDEMSKLADSSGSLNAAQLETLQPGLEGFFARWWDEQSQLWRDRPMRLRPIYSVLSLLACALGPLSREDLLSLAPSNVGLSSWSLDEAMYSLRRFVIGNGVETGYSFCHSRLNYFFYERLGLAERQEWEGCFLNWGENLLKQLKVGVTDNVSVPEYLVRHYGAHLDRADAPLDRLQGLLTEGWLRVWERLDPSHSGFLSDVHRVWKQARLKPDVAVQVLCALCQSSVVALSSEVPDSLILRCFERKIISPIYVLGLVKNNPNIWQRVRVLPKIFPLLDKEMQDEVLRVFRSFKFRAAEVQGLCAIANHQSPTERNITLSRAIALAEGIDDNHPGKWESLYHLLLVLPDDRVGWIIDSARRLRDPSSRGRLLLVAARRLDGLEQSHVLREVLTCFLQEDKPRWRISKIASVAHYLNGSDKEEALSAIFNDLRKLELEIKEIKFWISEAHDIADSMIDALVVFPDALRDDALRVARSLPKGAWRALLIAAIGRRSPPHEQEELFKECMEACRIDAWHVDSDRQLRVAADLSGLLPAPEKVSFLEDLLTTMSHIREERWGWVLAAVAEAAPEEFFEKCLKIARTIRTGKERSQALVNLQNLAPSETHEELLKEAWEAARTINDEYDLCKVLASMLEKLNEKQRRKLCPPTVDVANMLRGARQAETLLRLIKYMDRSQRERVRGDLVSLLENVEERDLEDVLRTGWVSIPEELRVTCLQRLLLYFGRISKVNLGTYYALRLAKHLPAEDRSRIVDESRSKLANSVEEYWKPIALGELSSYASSEEERSLTLEQALQATRQLTTWHERTWNFVFHLEYVDGNNRRCLVDEILKSITPDMNETPNEENLAKILVKLANYADNNQLLDIIQISKGLDKIRYRLQVLIGVIKYLDEKERRLFVEDVLRQLSTTEEEQVRADVCTSLLPFLDGAERIDALKKAADSSCNPYARRTANLKVLGFYLAEWSVIDEVSSHEAGGALLQSCAAEQRSSFLNYLEALLPWISKAGGSKAMGSIATALIETHTWWP